MPELQCEILCMKNIYIAMCVCRICDTYHSCWLNTHLYQLNPHISSLYHKFYFHRSRAKPPVLRQDPGLTPILLREEVLRGLSLLKKSAGKFP